MKNEVNRTLVVKKNNVKKYPLLGALLLFCGMFAFAKDPSATLDVANEAGSNAFYSLDAVPDIKNLNWVGYNSTGSGSGGCITESHWKLSNSRTLTFKVKNCEKVWVNAYFSKDATTNLKYAINGGTATGFATNGTLKKTCAEGEFNTSNTGEITIVLSADNDVTIGEVKFYKTGGSAPVTPTVNSVTVSPTSATLDPNNTQQLTANVDATPASADKSVTWASNNPSVATVSESGLVTAVAQGTATITATSNLDNTKSGTCNITVNAPAAPIPVTAIALNKSTAIIGIGDSETLTINYTPADANTGKAVNWTSSNTSIATVDNSGKVTGVAVGTATITATSTTDASITASCAVTVQAVAVTGVSINPTSANLQIGGSTDLTYTILPANATDKSVSWSSSNTAVANVNNNGHVSAVAAGTATITVTTTDGNKTATCSVTVTAGPPVPPTSLTTHVPEVYEAKDIAGGYNTPLTVVGGREYEVFYINRDNSSNLTIATSNVDKAGNICDDSGTSNTARTKDGWLTISCNGTGGDTNAGAKDEFQASIRSAKFNSSSHVMEMHIQGYDQFSFYGNDNNQNPDKGKMFEIYIDDVKQTRSPQAYAINRFDITSGEHVIKLSAIGGSDSKLCSFSLRVSQEPRTKWLKGNDSTQTVMQTTAIQPVVYTTKYNNIPGAETRLLWLGSSEAEATGISLTKKPGSISDTLTLGGIANCATGEYNYAVVAYYNGAEKNRVTGKFYVKSDIKSITQTNVTVYQNEEMDQIKFRYYALSAEDVQLTWTGSTPNGITGSGTNGTYIIGGTPTQTGEFPYSITVQGADTTLTGKITVRELDYGTNPVLYLYKNENAYESDGVRNFLKTKGWNTIERKAKEEGLRPADQYEKYKFVVISEDVDADNPEVLRIIAENGSKLPVLNLKGFTYAEGRLSWGDPSNGAIDSTQTTKSKGSKIKIMHADHPIFAKLGGNAKEGGEITILSNYVLQGVMPIAIDMHNITTQSLCMGTAPIRANSVDGYYEEGSWEAAIHEVQAGARNGKKYICLPLARNVTLTTIGERLIEGIVDYLVSPTPTTITAPDLLITKFAVSDSKGKEYTADIDQEEHTITLKLQPEEYQALDSLKEAKPTITHPNYTSVTPASGESVKLTYAYLRPQQYIVTDYINKNVYNFILELYAPEQGIEEVYEVGQWVNIYDIYGRKVTTTNEDIYTMELPRGMYIIVTESGKTMKIMK